MFYKLLIQINKPFASLSNRAFVTVLPLVGEFLFSSVSLCVGSLLKANRYSVLSYMDFSGLILCLIRVPLS